MPSMKAIIAFSAFIALSHAQIYGPIHGCESTPLASVLTNFTLSTSPSNSTTADYVTWRFPDLYVSCDAANSPATGNFTAIGLPGSTTSVPCSARFVGTTNARFVVAEDGKNATIHFVTYNQCAASRYSFYYDVFLDLDCVGGAGGRETCGSKGNATAVIIRQLWMPPISNPPPPPR